MTPQQTLSLAKAKTSAIDAHATEHRYMPEPYYVTSFQDGWEAAERAMLEMALASASGSSHTALPEDAPGFCHAIRERDDADLSRAKAKASAPAASAAEAFVAWVKEPTDICGFQLRADQQTGFLAGWKAAVGEGEGEDEKALAFAPQKSTEAPPCVRCHGEGIVRSPVPSLPMDCPLCCGGVL